MAKNDGFEPVDDTPVSIPVQFRHPPGEVDRLRAMIANVLSKEIQERGGESFEESLDFDTGEDEDGPLSQSETRFMQEERLLTAAEEASRVALQRKEAAQLRKRFTHGSSGEDGKQGVHAAASRSGSDGPGDAEQESGAEDRRGDGRGRDGGLAEKKG